MAGFRKISQGLLKLIAAIFIVAFLFLFWITGGKFFQKSDMSNCVVVDLLEHFTGERLQHSEAIFYSRVKTQECIDKDKRIDQGDGPEKGKVRWVECSYGPDCDEVGMF